LQANFSSVLILVLDVGKYTIVISRVTCKRALFSLYALNRMQNNRNKPSLNKPKSQFTSLAPKEYAKASSASFTQECTVRMH